MQSTDRWFGFPGAGGSSAFVFSRIGLTLAALILCLSPTAAIGQETLAEVEAASPEAISVLAQFTTGIENREPIDQVTFVENNANKVYFFTDLRGLDGRTILHRWSYNGEVMAEVRFEVRGPRWRVWSSKDLLPDWIGDWTVEIVSDDGGEVIGAETFTYSAPEA